MNVQMNQFKTIGLLLLASLFLSTSAAAKVYVCGSTGTLLYSDRPCEVPKTDWSIMPVTAENLNQDSIDQIVTLFRKATLTKDVLAIKRLLSDDFTFVSRDNSWTGRVIYRADRAGFVALMTDQLLAMTSYEQKIESYAVNSIGNELVAETTSAEKIEMGERKINARILERIYLKLDGDQVKIKAIKQLELK